MKHQEIEVRFLEINKDDFIARLNELGATDHGEDLLDERIIFDKKLLWQQAAKFMRLRTKGGKTTLAYKDRENPHEPTAHGTEEIEFQVSDPELAQALLYRLGYEPFRYQQKKRHSFSLDDVQIDIDTWPRIPTYIEIEGPSVDALKSAAQKLGLDWKNVEFRDPKLVIEQVYGIPIGEMKWFTFDRFE
jgi:adenylate cyclase class 2